MKREKQREHKNYIKLGLIVLVLFLIAVFIQQIRHSLVLSHKDRINVIIYDAQPVLYSFGRYDGVHYKGEFDPKLSLLIPGGYGSYTIKALGELARIEKKPNLIKNSFSSLTSSSIDYIFYSNQPKNSQELLSLFKLFRYSTNASFLDRILLYFTFLNKKPGDFSIIRFNTFTDKEAPLEDHYFKKYQGYFYEKKLREENKNIQLKYYNRSSVLTISRIMEGEGIRVVDLSYSDKVSKGCVITRNRKAIYTEEYLQSHFKCIIKTGETAGQDMIVELGSEVEKEWE